MKNSVKQHASALTAVLACLALALVLYHSLAGGTLLQSSPYNSYALQAENWLAGRNNIANGENYTWLELAIYQGRYYQSFPPVPAVLMLPFVAAAGEWSAIPGNLIAMGLALLCAGGVYACCMRGGMQPVTCAFFTLFVSMGSNVFWMSTSDGVWFLAQVCALGFAFWGLFFAQGGNAVQDAAASLCMALAVGCRPFYALLLACWLGWQFYQRRSLKKILPALLPAVVMAACMMAYNFARFGSVTEFGHNYLPEFVRAENGQFSLTYLVPNLLQLLRPVTLVGRYRIQLAPASPAQYLPSHRFPARRTCRRKLYRLGKRSGTYVQNQRDGRFYPLSGQGIYRNQSPTIQPYAVPPNFFVVGQSGSSCQR